MSQAKLKPLFSEAYKAWVIGLLLVVYILNFADRVVIGAMGEAIKRDLNLSDGQLGALGGLSFTILYIVIGFPAGRLAERLNRKTMVGVVIFLWSAATALCGTAQNFWQLLIYRAAVGVGEGGFTPPVLSMMSDYFPPNRRATAYSLVVLGIPIGSALGLAIGGWMVEHYGWQAGFFVVGAPGVLVAALVLLTLREPPRGYSEGATAAAQAAPAPSISAVFKRLAGKPAFWNLAVAGGLANVVGFGFNIFLIPYLVRAYDLDLYAAAGAVGLITGLALGIAMASGGPLIDLLGRRDVRWYAWAPAVGILLALPLYVFAFIQQSSWQLTVGLAFVAAILIMAFLQTTQTTNQGLVEPRMRGTASAVGAAINTGIGLGFGSMLLGAASDFFARRAFAAAAPGLDYGALCDRHGAAGATAQACATASATGLQHAFLFCAVFLIWSALHFVFASRTLKRDAVVDYGQSAKA